MTDRRDLLRGAAALTVATWIAPSVVTLDRVSAAVGSVVAEMPAVGGGAVLIDPPATIAEGTAPYDSNANTWVWSEQSCVVLASALGVNRTAAGSFGGSNFGGSIPAGTTICSFYVHGDRLDDNGRLQGNMTFTTSTILGLIFKTTQLNNSAFLESPTTTYFPAPMEGNDRMVLDLTPGANSLSWDMRFGAALDGIRVITDCG